MIVMVGMTVFMAAEEIDQIYDRVMDFYAEVNSFQGDFEQINYWQNIDRTVVSRGKIYYDTHRFILQYSEPAGQKLLIDKDVMYLIDVSSKQVMITDEFDFELRPEKIIESYWQDSEKEVFQSDEGRGLRLKTYEQTIEVQMKNGEIAQIEIYGSEGNKVTYNLSEKSYNIDLQDKVFRIDIPRDYAVIDLRKEDKNGGQR